MLQSCPHFLLLGQELQLHTIYRSMVLFPYNLRVKLSHHRIKCYFHICLLCLCRKHVFLFTEVLQICFVFPEKSVTPLIIIGSKTYRIVGYIAFVWYLQLIDFISTLNHIHEAYESPAFSIASSRESERLSGFYPRLSIGLSVMDLVPNLTPSPWLFNLDPPGFKPSFRFLSITQDTP